MLNKRQEKIIQYLADENFAKVEALSERFCVSNETIRRDLVLLEKELYIKRNHGGALYDNLRAKEKQYEGRTKRNFAEKRAIAKLAARYVSEGDTIAMNTGTSTLELAKVLVEKNELTVITNSVDVAALIAENPSNHVYMPGGYLRKEGRGLSGVLTCEFLSKFKVDKTILSVGGLSVEHGVTEYHVEESAVMRKMIEIGNVKMALCDFSKYKEVALNKVCEVQELDYIFTDWNARISEMSKCRSKGTKVYAAERPINS